MGHLSWRVIVQDVDVLDVTIPNTVNNITTVLMRLFSSLIIIVFATPAFTAVLVPVMLLYLFILVS